MRTWSVYHASLRARRQLPFAVSLILQAYKEISFLIRLAVLSAILQRQLAGVPDSERYVLSLTPRFSEVAERRLDRNSFSGFPSRWMKTVKNG